MIQLASKYRPSKFSQLDQEKVRQFFERMLKSNQVSQAYLFTGPKGTGKTSAARILAAMLNCENNQNRKGEWNEPCGDCERCVAVRKGRSGAVVEIDAASNRGIDDIRILRERIGLMPTDGDYSVYIVDEVHMLTKEAFNALLKTLEEPPEHVVFCLCTTEVEKLPATVVSRCVRVNYSLASQEELVRSLKRVVKGEKIKADEEALRLIANYSEGSFRDATKLLGQLVSEEKITTELVYEALGTKPDQSEKLLEAILAGEITQALGVLEQMEEAGMEMSLLAKSLMMLSSQRVKQDLHKGGQIDKKVLTWIEVLGKAFARFEQVPIPALPLEMAIVEFGLSRGKISYKETKMEKEVNKVVGVGEEKVREKTKAEKVVKEETTNQVKVVKDISKKKVSKEAIKLEPQDNEVVSQKEVLLEDVMRHWSGVLTRVEEANHGLLALLKRATVSECKGNVLWMRVGYKFHKEQLEQERYLVVLEKVIEEVLGERLKLKVELGEKPNVTGYDANLENVSGTIPKEDQVLIETVEEVFGVETAA